nr:hypothetical protein CFP56_28559 [Quercus suber]
MICGRYLGLNSSRSHSATLITSTEKCTNPRRILTARGQRGQSRLSSSCRGQKLPIPDQPTPSGRADEVVALSSRAQQRSSRPYVPDYLAGTRERMDFDPTRLETATRTHGHNTAFSFDSGCLGLDREVHRCRHFTRSQEQEFLVSTIAAVHPVITHPARLDPRFDAVQQSNAELTDISDALHSTIRLTGKERTLSRLRQSTAWRLRKIQQTLATWQWPSAITTQSTKMVASLSRPIDYAGKRAELGTA